MLVITLLLVSLLASSSVLSQSQCVKAGSRAGGWLPSSGAPLLTSLDASGAPDMCGANVGKGKNILALRFAEGCADPFYLPGRDLQLGTSDDIHIVRWVLSFQLKSGTIDSLSVFLRDANDNEYIAEIPLNYRGIAAPTCGSAATIVLQLDGEELFTTNRGRRLVVGHISLGTLELSN